MLGKLFKQASTLLLNGPESLKDSGNTNGLHTSLSGETLNGNGNRNINYLSQPVPPTSKNGEHTFNGTIQLPPPVFTGQNANSPVTQSPSYTSDDSYSKQSLYGTVNNIRHSNLQFKFFRLVVCQDGGSLRSKQILYDSTATEGSLPPPSPVSLSQGSSFTPSTPPANLSSSSMGKGKGLHHHSMISSKIHHHIGELNDYMFGCGLPSSETNCITKIHLLPKLTSLAHGSNNSVLVTRLFLITTGEFSAAQTESSVFKMTKPDSWNPTAAFPTKGVFIKNLKSPSGVSLNSTSSPPGPNQSPIMNASKTGSISSKFAIGIVIPLDAPEDDLMDILISDWDEISHYLILLQKVIAKKLVAVLRHSLDVSPNGSSPYITNTKRIQFPNWTLQHEPEILHQYFKLIKLISYDTNLPRLINSNALIKSSMSKTSSKYNSLLLNWVLEVLNWLEFKDNKQLAKPSIQTTTSSKSSTLSLTTVSNSITFNNKGPTQSSNVPFLTSSPLKHGNVESNAATHSQPNTPESMGFSGISSAPELIKTYHTFLATLFSLVLPLREKLAIKPVCDNATEDELKRKRKDVNRIVIMTGNPAVAKKLIFILNALIPDDSLYDSCKLDFSIVDESEEVLFEDDEESISEDKMAALSPKLGKCSLADVTQGMMSLVPTASANSVSSGEKSSIKSPLTQKSLYTSSDDLPSYLDSSPGVETVKETISSISKSPTVEPIPIKKGKRGSGGSLASRASDQSLKSGWEIPYKSTPFILTLHRNNSTATSSVETSTATAQVIPISYNPPQQQQLNFYHRNSSVLKSSSYAYLSSSLNSSLSSLASQFSLSKLGGSLLEKWKWSSNNSNQSLLNPSGGNSAVTPNATSGNGNYYFGQQSLGQSIGNSQTLNLSSLMNQGGINGNGNYTYNSSYDVGECIPPSAIGSLTKRSSVHSLRTPSPAIADHYEDQQLFPPAFSHHHHHHHLMSTPNKLSRTQSMYELYNKTSSHMPGIYDNTSGVLAIKDKLTLKRSSNSAYLPLIDDSAVKNVATHNSNYIRHKCMEIMNSKALKITTNETLNALEIPLYTVHEQSVLIKKKALLPVVAFADEFRPEFTIQSCPMSPKLENQILIAMKNDVIFYQSHCQYEEVTSRTIFVSLRARELKVLEMTGSSIQNLTSTSDHEGLLSSISNEGVQGQYPQLGISPQKSNSTLKSKQMRKRVSSYTSSKPLTQSERKRISAIDSIFDEIAHLVSASQAKLARRTEAVAEEDILEDEEYGQSNPSPTIAGFDDQLSRLMTKLFE